MVLVGGGAGAEEGIKGARERGYLAPQSDYFQFDRSTFSGLYNFPEL